MNRKIAVRILCFFLIIVFCALSPTGKTSSSPSIGPGTATPPYKYVTGNTWTHTLLAGWAFSKANYQTGIFAINGFSYAGGASAEATHWVDVEIPSGQLCDVYVSADIIYTGGIQKIGLMGSSWGGIDKVWYVGDQYKKSTLDAVFGYDDIGWAAADFALTLIPGWTELAGLSNSAKVVLIGNAVCAINDAVKVGYSFYTLLQSGKARRANVNFSFQADQTTPVGVGLRVDTSGCLLGACDAIIYGFVEKINVRVVPVPAEGYWNFDGWSGSGNIADNSDNNNVAIPSGGPASTDPGRKGKGIRFDGDDDWVKLNFDASELDTLEREGTIALWVKPDQYSDAVLVYGGKGSSANSASGAQEFHLGTDSTGRFVLRLSSLSANNVTNYIRFGSYTPDEWTHVAVNYTNWGLLGPLNLYINGRQVEPSYTRYPTPYAPASLDFDDLRLGRPNAEDKFFKGEMDEVRIYNRFIDETTIRSLCWQGIDTTPPTVPVMIDEPAYTPGNGNRVAWNPASDYESGVARYQVQILKDGEFYLSNLTSELFFDYDNLEEGPAYSYLARAVDHEGNWSGWSAPVVSRQDASNPVVSSFPVDYTQKGDIVGNDIRFVIPPWFDDDGSGIRKIVIDQFGGTSYTIDYPECPNVISSLEARIPLSKGYIFAQEEHPGTFTGSVQDGVGNTTDFQFNFRLDYRPPQGTITINDDAPYTSDRAVTLNLAYWDPDGDAGYDVGLGVTGVRFRNENGEWSAWEGVADSKEWTLSEGYGLKAVYTQYHDGYGYHSGIYHDSINYCLPPTGEILINYGATWATHRNVILTMEAPGADQIAIWNDDPHYEPIEEDWEDFRSQAEWTLSAGKGLKTVYIRFKNEWGIESETYSDSIYLDYTIPWGTVTINGGAARTGSSTVTLGITAGDSDSGVTLMRFSEDAENWTPWETFQDTRLWELSPGEGKKKVFIEVRDEAGNKSLPANDDIFVDLCPPHGTVEINGGAAYTGSTTVTVRSSLLGQKYSLPEQFASQQGEMGWSYYRTDCEGTYVELYWDKVLGEKMQDFFSWNVSEGEDEDGDLQVTGPEQGAFLQPGSGKLGAVALAWTPGDRATTVNVKGELWSAWPNSDPSGDLDDGVSFTILLNGEPLTDPILVFHDEKYGYGCAEMSGIKIEPGDVIYFQVDPGISPEMDRVYYHFSVVDADEPGPAYVRFANLKPENLGEARYESDIFWWTALHDVDWSDWRPLDPHHEDSAWSIPAGDGYKTVMAQFRDGSGNISPPYRAGIVLDQAPPPGSITINDGALETGSATLQLDLWATDILSGVAQMKISENGAEGAWEPYARKKAWSLSAQEGVSTLSAVFKDTAGNISPPCEARILYNSLYQGSLLAPLPFARVELADLNGDGLPDLLGISPRGRGRLLVAINEGRRGYHSDPEALPGPLTGIHRVLPVDLDHDGDLDLVVIPVHTESGATVLILLNDGEGVFSATQMSTGLDHIIEGTVGDLDNDGRPDLVLSGKEGLFYRTKIYFNQGGTFIYGSQIDDVYALSMAIGDLSGDGSAGLLLGQVNFPGRMNGPQVIDVYRYDGGSFTRSSKYEIGQALGVQAQGRFPMCLYDLDGDGDLDLISGGSKTVASLNYGNYLLPQEPEETTFFDIASNQITPVDIDSDGVLDLILTESGDSLNTVHIGLSWGELSAGALYPVQYECYSNVAAGDLDGDGRADLLLGYMDGELAPFYIGMPGGLQLVNRSSANSEPQAPDGLAAVINDNQVVLSWNPAADDETPQNHLTYNLRVGTTLGGNEIISGAIPTGFGNMGCFLSKELNLPDGKYHWSVQAVDGAYVVSPWSKDRAFTIDHVIKGDVSGDGNINVADAILLLRSIVGLVQLDQQQSEAADVNGDGAVNVGDAIMILRFIVGLITEFPLS